MSTLPLLDGVFRRFVWSRIHFAESEMRLLDSLKPGLVDVAVDVGAALGSYTWVLSRLARHVYAFEAGLVHSRYLRRAAFLANIEVIHAAVGKANSRVTLYTPGTDTEALHSATVSSDNPIAACIGTRRDDVEQVTLDGFLRRRLDASRVVDIVKIDVEGYELEVLEGSLDILGSHHPLIICEIEARHNPTYHKVLSLLRGLGYSCYIFRAGRFDLFSSNRIEHLQSVQDLRARLSRTYDPDSTPYINNFVFEHPLSRVSVTR